MKATVVIDVSMDMENSKISYDVALLEGDCNGLNQLAQNLKNQVEENLSLPSKNSRTKEK